MPKGKNPPTIEDVLAKARDTLEATGTLNRQAIKPPSIRDEVVARLAALGFEVTAAKVRRPLEAQLRAALADGAHLPMAGLRSVLIGATAAEGKAAALAMVRDGKAKLIARGKVQVLASADADVLSREELHAAARAIERAGKALKQGLGRAKVATAILRADLRQELEEALFACAPRPGGTREASSRREAPPPDDALARLLTAVEAAQDPRMGMAFVPHVMMRLGMEADPARGQHALLDAEARGLIELRPEGGLSRMAEDELALCPPGPHGTRLSWARIVGGAGS